MVEPRDSVTDLRARLLAEQRRLDAVRELGRALGANLDLDHILTTIVHKVPELIDAERATLYLLRELDRPPGAELVSKVVMGGLGPSSDRHPPVVQEIRLNLGVGIAGSVAESGAPLNIPDAYADSRFNPDVDRRTGFVTRSILCVPVPDHAGRICGVLQALNRRGGPFDQDDEALLLTVAAYAGAAIENSQLFESQRQQNAELRRTQRHLQRRLTELDLLFQIERESSAAMDLPELIERLSRRAVELLGGAAGLLALRRRTGELELTAVRPAQGTDAGGELELRRLVLPLRGDQEQSLLPWVVHNRLPLCINDPGAGVSAETWTTLSRAATTPPMGVPALGSPSSLVTPPMGMPAILAPPALTLPCADPLRQLTELLELPVTQALAVPLDHAEAQVDGDDDSYEALGVIVVVNKRPRGAAFAVEDLKLLTLIGGHAARAVVLSRTRALRTREGHLASIGRMLASVMHDLRAPLTIVSGYAQLMVASEDQAERERYAAMITKQFNLMQAMTGEVMAFARGETRLLLRRVLINRFVEELREQLLREIPPNIELVLEPRYLGPAYFDELKLLRLVHNLARNAIQAMPQGGVLHITVDSAYGPGTDARHRELVFTFSDTGGGLPDEVQAHLFEAFVSANKDGGTGLGLAIVKKIVDDHQGRIGVTTHRGEGTSFTVAIPLSRE